MVVQIVKCDMDLIESDHTHICYGISYPVGHPLFRGKGEINFQKAFRTLFTRFSFALCVTIKSERVSLL